MHDSSERALPTSALSTARGKIQREVVPRGTHAGVAARSEDFDPVSVLEHQAMGRVPELLPIRYARMAADPFSFLRGADALMTGDLGAAPSTDLSVQLCGDAHLANFGVFRSPEGRVVFDVNDFDETHVGPFEWDVKRLAASVAVAADELRFSEAEGLRAVAEAVAQYRAGMRGLAGQGNLKAWSAHLELDGSLERFAGALTDEWSRRAELSMAARRRKGRRAAYDRLVVDTSSGPRIASSPPLVVPLAEVPPTEGGEDAVRFLTDVVRGYERSLPSDRRHLLRQFLPIDAARMVVGVGSVGMRCYVVLLLGRDATDPFFLQVKEASASVLEAQLGPSKFTSPGHRVVAGQELLQATPDPFLGWLDVPDPAGATRSYYVRQLYDGKASADLTHFDAGLLRGYAAMCGWTLARAHARSGDRVAIASYLGKSTAFEDAVSGFAQAYVARNRADHGALLDAIASGRIVAAA
jgi:hypothetical protein